MNLVKKRKTESFSFKNRLCFRNIIDKESYFLLNHKKPTSNNSFSSNRLASHRNDSVILIKKCHVFSNPKSKNIHSHYQSPQEPKSVYFSTPKPKVKLPILTKHTPVTPIEHLETHFKDSPDCADVKTCSIGIGTSDNSSIPLSLNSKRKVRRQFFEKKELKPLLLVFPPSLG